MKKQRVVEEVVCDICGARACSKCELCKRDLCSNCARYICKKEEQPSSPWSSGWTIYYNQYTPEMTICKKCLDALKLSLRVCAGQSVKEKVKNALHKGKRESKVRKSN